MILELFRPQCTSGDGSKGKGLATSGKPDLLKGMGAQTFLNDLDARKNRGFRRRVWDNIRVDGFGGDTAKKTIVERWKKEALERADRIHELAVTDEDRVGNITNLTISGIDDYLNLLRENIALFAERPVKARDREARIIAAKMLAVEDDIVRRLAWRLDPANADKLENDKASIRQAFDRACKKLLKNPSR